MKRAIKRSWQTVVFTLLALAVVLVAVFPFYWMIVSSLKTDSELYQETPTMWPRNPTFKKYYDALVRGRFVRYILNSAFVTCVATMLSVALACLAGYGFARFRIPGGKPLIFGLLLTYTFPGILLAIPFYFIFRQLGLLDTLTSLIIVYITFALPHAIWTMRNYFLALPTSMEECALVDGCTPVQVLWKVVLPVAKPAMTAAATYCFIYGWNEFMFASIFISKPELRTISVGINAIIGEFTTDWGLLMAGSVIATVPIIILFAFLQQNLVQGLAAGSVKG